MPLDVRAPTADRFRMAHTDPEEPFIPQKPPPPPDRREGPADDPGDAGRPAHAPHPIEAPPQQPIAPRVQAAPRSRRSGVRLELPAPAKPEIIGRAAFRSDPLMILDMRARSANHLR